MSRSDILATLVQQPDAIKIMQEATSFFEKEKGDRHKFHELVHENIKAEFINGEVVMHSPVKREHWRTSSRLSKSLMNHVDHADLGEIGVEKVMIHLTRNDYEPDICFFSKEKVATFYSGQLLFPAPDFIVEILSATTEKTDRTIKMQDYAAHGVAEYWIVDPVHQSLEQYLLKNGGYILHVKLVKEGVIHSEAIAGYTLQLPDLF